MLYELRVAQRGFGSYRDRFIRVAVACVLAALCSCARRQLVLNVEIPRAADLDTAIALDLVVIQDKALADKVAAMNASDWFSNRDQIARDNPKVLSVEKREYVPGQVVPSIVIPSPSGLVIPSHAFSGPTILVFANYASPGPHRAKLHPNRVTTIHLKADDLSVEVDKK